MKLLIAALFAAVVSAQEPAGVIEGTVNDAITRVPLAGARVALHGPVGRTETSSLSGAFRFDQLPPGDYALVVTQPGYLDSTKGAPPRTVQVKFGALTESVAHQLTPLGALEGTVLDEDGKSLAGVYVTVAGSSLLTGKDGRFVFENLIPDSYTLAVSVPHAVRSATLQRDSATGDFYGYGAAQFYPGAAEARLAIPVVVSAGARLRNMDLRLRRTLLVEFSGILMDMPDGEPLTRAEVQLIGGVPGTPDPLWRKHAANPDGTFRFSLLQPGSYTLAIYRTGRSMLPYIVPVEIGKSGTEDLKVPVPPFNNLQGSIKLRDPKVQWSGTVRVNLGSRYGGTDGCDVHPDNTLECISIPPGEFRVQVESKLRVPGDRSRIFTARELQFGAQRGLRQPITVVENGNPPLEILLSDDPGGVSGKVLDDGRRANYIVTAYAAGTRNVTGMTVGSAEFQFPDLAPGDYEITARRFEPRSQRNQMSMQSCPETVRVTVREGSAATVTVRPCTD